MVQVWYRYRTTQLPVTVTVLVRNRAVPYRYGTIPGTVRYHTERLYLYDEALNYDEPSVPYGT